MRTRVSTHKQAGTRGKVAKRMSSVVPASERTLNSHQLTKSDTNWVTGWPMSDALIFYGGPGLDQSVMCIHLTNAISISIDTYESAPL